MRWAPFFLAPTWGVPSGLMKRATFVLFSLAFFLFSLKGFCEEPQPPVQLVKDIPPGPDTIVSVKKGDVAPFTGQLFDASTALRWSNWLLQYKLRLETETELHGKVAALDAKLAEDRLRIEKEKNAVITGDYQSQLSIRDKDIAGLKQQLSDPPFYRTVWFGVVLGTVITGVFAGLGAYAATR